MNHYEVLGISASATPADIVAAYRRQVKLTHPDNGGSVLLFRLVQDAYDVLSDATSRAAYDSELKGDTDSGAGGGSSRPVDVSRADS